MMTVKILIDSVDKIKTFTSIISKEDVECELIKGVHIVDAKSVMGVFSMDLREPVQLNIHSSNKGILKKIEDFIV
ncbi:MAG TPA: PTS sugar transporter [Ruminococcaceae bacterium]|nr:PTS sugar transporter [Oscillospiraceae bacterium]HCA28256.1 PTS sugar transporter [Oscillospiraceae bacterium]